jgi:hypothetical protein
MDQRERNKWPGRRQQESGGAVGLKMNLKLDPRAHFGQER